MSEAAARELTLDDLEAKVEEVQGIALMLRLDLDAVGTRICGATPMGDVAMNRTDTPEPFLPRMMARLALIEGVLRDGASLAARLRRASVGDGRQVPPR